MHFQHSERIWVEFPELVPVALRVGVHRHAQPGESGATDRSSAPTEEVYAGLAPHLGRFESRARARLDEGPESEFPQIQAWRRAFGRMGLKPTQYRCASEALLRRFRKEGQLPRINPLVDLCNAISLAYAVPIAVLDLARINGDLTVTYAEGTESYTTFGGERENPTPGEVVFTDTANVVHARRWTNRQSGLSAVGDETGDALIVAEALHDAAALEIPLLGEELAAVATESVNGRPLIGSVTAGPTVLSATAPRFAAGVSPGGASVER